MAGQAWNVKQQKTTQHSGTFYTSSLKIHTQLFQTNERKHLLSVKTEDEESGKEKQLKKKMNNVESSVSVLPFTALSSRRHGKSIHMHLALLTLATIFLKSDIQPGSRRLLLCLLSRRR